MHRAPATSWHKVPVTQNFDVFFDVSLHKSAEQTVDDRWFDTSRLSCDIAVSHADVHLKSRENLFVNNIRLLCPIVFIFCSEHGKTNGQTQNKL